jgi:indole-3-glycerol phosphate synthase
MAPHHFLDRIIERKRERLAAAMRERPTDEVRREAEARRRDAAAHAFSRALAENQRVSIIAEFKRASPSKGEIRGVADAVEVATAYEAGGAAALSVLTEEDFFRGSLRDLSEVKAAVSLPVLRKDFLFDAYQIHEAAAAGADAVLLIAAALTDDALTGLRSLAEDELGLDALVEVHTPAEMRRAALAGARLVGVNNRDLHTFHVSLETSIEVGAEAPAGALLVSESGLRGASDIKRLRECGYHAFLIGETLMRAADPAHALRELLEGSAAP